MNERVYIEPLIDHAKWLYLSRIAVPYRVFFGPV